MPITSKTVKINPVKYHHNQKKRGRSYNKKTYIKPKPKQTPRTPQPKKTVSDTLPKTIVQIREQRAGWKTRTHLAAQQNRLQQQKKQVDVFGQYEHQGRSISGFEAQSIIGQQQKQTTDLWKQQVRNEKQFQKTVSQYPSGTTLSKTDEGYSVTVPEREQLRWTEQALQETTKQPPVQRAVSETALGIMAPVFATGQFVASIFGQRAPYEQAISGGTSVFLSRWQPLKAPQVFKRLESKRTYGVYYPSVPDVALEKIGWAPKGSTRTLTSRSSTYAIGATLGEGAVGYLFGKAIGKTAGGIAKKLGYTPKPRTKTLFPVSQSKPTTDIIQLQKGGLRLRGVALERSIQYKKPFLGHIKVGTRSDRLLFKGVYAKVPKTPLKATTTLRPGGKTVVGWVQRTPTSLSATKMTQQLSSLRGILKNKAVLKETYAKLVMTQGKGVGVGGVKPINIPSKGFTYGIYNVGGTTTAAASRGGLRQLPKLSTTLSTSTPTSAITTSVTRTQSTGAVSVSRGMSVLGPSISMSETISRMAPASIRQQTPRQQIRRGLISISMPVSDTYKGMSIRTPATHRTSAVVNVRIPSFGDDQIFVPKVTPKQTTSPAVIPKQIVSLTSYTSVKPSLKVPVVIPPSLRFGGGATGWGNVGASPAYKFRKFNIGGLLK